MFDQLADAKGVVLRRDAVAHGVDDNALARARRAGVIVRIRQGAYALASTWDPADRLERHRILAHAVMRQYDGRVALSHASAAVVDGAPMWGIDLADVHVTSLLGSGERAAAGIRHHRGTCLVADVRRAGGHWTTSHVRTALDTAALALRDPAVCVLDWYLRNGLVTREQLSASFLAMESWPGTLGLHRKLQLCDPRSDSVGDTRSRLILHDSDLPTPEPQCEIYYPNGMLAGRTDFWWRKHGLLGEFDGKQKYLEHRRPGESIEDAVLREKRREDLLRGLTGCRMIRWTWYDLEHPAQLIERIRHALHQRAA